MLHIIILICLTHVLHVSFKIILLTEVELICIQYTQFQNLLMKKEKKEGVPNISSLKNYVDEKSNAEKFRPRFEFS